jgi:hypothetical protein
MFFKGMVGRTTPSEGLLLCFGTAAGGSRAVPSLHPARSAACKLASVHLLDLVGVAVVVP